MDRNEHFYETCYEVWMSGGNPDRVDYDSCVDDFYNDKTPEYSTRRILNKQRINHDEQENTF